jgi:DNA-binding transcriptional regulator LsrR (DeoR family)
MKVTGMAAEMRCEIPLSQSEIADALRLSTVHVNRTLQELRRGRLIRSEGKFHRFED